VYIYKNVYITVLQDLADGYFVDDFYYLVLMSSDKKCKCRYSSVKEVVMLDMKGHMVVLGMALGTLMVPGYWSLQMG